MPGCPGFGGGKQAPFLLVQVLRQGRDALANLGQVDHVQTLRGNPPVGNPAFAEQHQTDLADP
jgi:hypothetical protein